MNRGHVSWCLWAIGAAMIALSWFGTVDRQFGWMGFFAGLVGSVRHPGASAPEEDVWEHDSPEA